MKPVYISPQQAEILMISHALRKVDINENRTVRVKIQYLSNGGAFVTINPPAGGTPVDVAKPDKPVPLVYNKAVG